MENKKEKKKPDVKETIMYPFRLTLFTESKTYLLQKQFAIKGKIIYSKTRFKVGEIPALAKLLYKLTPFRKEFRRVAKDK